METRSFKWPHWEENLEIRFHLRDRGQASDMIPMEMKLVTQRDLLVVGLVHILEENGRNESMSKIII
jgi:hypothetical protein